MAGTTPDTLIRLLHAAQRGDRTALEALLTRIHPAIIGYARRRLHGVREPEEVAQDLAQEVLIRVAEQITTCRATSEAQMHGWYLTITRHLIIDFLRAPSVRREQTDDVEACEAAAVMRVLQDQDGPGWTLEMGLLARAQEQLRPDTQSLLYHRLVESAGWEELGELCGSTPGGAKRRFQRATARLRKEIETQVGHLPPDQRALLRRSFRQ